MKRLVRNIRPRRGKSSVRLSDVDLTDMQAAELRELAGRLRRDIQASSAMLARVETQIALSECGRVRGRASSLQQRRFPPVLSNPGSGSALGDDLQIFHDGSDGELFVRQRQFSGGTGEAPFPLEIEVFQFDGDFLSVVQNLPDDLVQGTSDQDVFELGFAIGSDVECEIYMRLNIRHGPNETQLTRSCRTASRRQVQSFDMAEAELSHRPVERIWIDIIFSDPVMNRIVISDLVARRRARAQV